MKKFPLSLLAGLCMGLSGLAHAADKPPVKIGVLTDMSGTYASMGGPGSVAAAQLAIDDCLKAECKGMKIELVSADNQNKADVGAAKAREWFDRDGVGDCRSDELCGCPCGAGHCQGKRQGRDVFGARHDRADQRQLLSGGLSLDV
jgi:hypothetical protein